MQARLGSSAAAGWSRKASVMGPLWKNKLHCKEKQLANLE